MHRTPSNKVYIGITGGKPEVRWNKGTGYKRHRYFKYAVEKYGWDNIEHIVLVSGLSKEWACKLERILIRQYKSTDRQFGYNCSDGGEFDNPGGNITESGREKLRQLRLGKHLSESAKQKIGDANRGRTHTVSEEVRKRIGDANRGKTHTVSEETRKKIAAASAERVFSEETREKIRQALRGKQKSAEQTERLRNLTKGRIWVNNGIESKMIYPEDLTNYLDNNYVLGRNKTK